VQSVGVEAGGVEWQGCVHFPKLLLLVGGTCMRFRRHEGVCVFLNALSEVQFTCVVCECSFLYLV
jgi:hypothetical protein